MFKQLFPLLAMALACVQALAETATVPWTEFKDLYTEHLEKKLRGDADAHANAAPDFTLRSADIRLKVQGDSAVGEIVLTGETLAPPPIIVPLLSNAAAVTAVRNETGGNVVRAKDGIALRSNIAGTFTVSLEVVIPIAQDHHARLLELHAPSAISNSLFVDLPAGARAIALPGFAGADGRRHIAANETHVVRFINDQEATAAMPPAIDIFSEITLHQRRLRLTTVLAPQQVLARPFDLQLPAGARVVSSNLKDNWWTLQSDGVYRVDLPVDLESPVEIVCDIDADESKPLSLLLPHVRDNIGAEGNFSLLEPVQTRVALQGAGLASNLPADQLPEPIRERWPHLKEFDFAGDQQPLTLTMETRAAVKTPELVLDALNFNSTYSEDGQLLTRMDFNVPATAGTRLRLKPVPDAEVWSVQVNGVRSDILKEDGSAWIVPLPGDKGSHVEIALLTRKDKPSLAGKLELVLPATGLSARTLNYGLELPKRVELISMESDLSPATVAATSQTKAANASTYSFSRSFYRGEAIPVALMYREPVTAPVDANKAVATNQ
ncbi:MAG: hypothetical protein U1F34_06985 [Gammaproteobacteria bacterium]